MTGITDNIEKILPVLSEAECLKEWTLVGGTALAIQIGHRERFAKDMRFQQLNPKYDVDAVQIEQFFRTEIASELESSMKKK